MKKNLNPLLLAAAGLLATATSAAQANLLVNGSFEDGPSPGTTFVNLTGGSTVVTGWTVTGSTIDYVGGLWVASDGSRSIDLDGSVGSPYTHGGVAQTFATTPGARYEVRFDLASNPYNLPTLKPMRVAAAGQSQDFSFDFSGHSVTDMGWLAQTWTFSAVATTTTLEFSSLTQAPHVGWGAALDHVSVTTVPEPSAALMLALGLGLLGPVALRRHRAEAGRP